MESVAIANLIEQLRIDGSSARLVYLVMVLGGTAVSVCFACTLKSEE